MKQYSIERTTDLSDQLQIDLENRWDSFIAANESIATNFSNNKSFIASLKEVFLYSDFVLKRCQMAPELILDLYASGDLTISYSDTAYSEKLQETLEGVTDQRSLAKSLRYFRNRELIRIAWRDLLNEADLAETLSDLSAVAETCIDQTFEILYRWLAAEKGTPVDDASRPIHIVVLGMGKLGAGELNFSSDVDLIFAFPESGSTTGVDNPVTNEQFFTTLCQQFIRVFGEKGPDGILYRVDMRLRPFGESGPLVMSFNALEDYYQSQGREWERYALIKANVVAGDRTDGRNLLERLRPFVYRRYLDFSVYESLREMKYNIAVEVDRKGNYGNIKIGAGGIREVEFFGQIFQLVRGGVEKHLQERAILKVLEHLAADQYISQTVAEELSEGYVFLRYVENRLQEYDDQQVHVLPKDPMQKTRLAASMGFSDWDSFYAELDIQTGKIHFHFNDLLLVDEDENSILPIDEELTAVWLGVRDREDVRETLEGIGYANPDEVIGLVDYLKNDSSTRHLSPKSRGLLDKLMPLVLKHVGTAERPELVLGRIIELIKTIEQRTIYLSLLLENPDALTHLVKLSSASPWIVSFLARHPILLDELLDRRTLYQPPKKDELEKDLIRRLKQIDNDDLEKQLEELIIFKNVNVFHVAAADISGGFQLMKVSDYLSNTAETVLSQVLQLSWPHLVGKYGHPTAILDGERCEMGFVIIAYGKLGGLELGYGSDLDLVFLNAAVDGDTDGGEMTIDNSQFFAKLGQRVVHLLTTNTRAGKLYEIDMRLRPNGNSGILVSKIDAFADYQYYEAWTWEHQALIRARPICGDPRMIEKFKAIKRRIISRKRDAQSLKDDIQTMRAKMKKEKETVKSGWFDIKQGDGGMVDIEFLVQYLTLLYAVDNDELARWTDNVRLIGALNKIRVLDNDSANLLRGSYLIYRSEVHRLNLQEKSTVVPEDTFQGRQIRVREVWNRFLG